VATAPGVSPYGTVTSAVPRIVSRAGATPEGQVEGTVAMTMATAANR
jgi:hypothetical protein